MLYTKGSNEELWDKWHVATTPIEIIDVGYWDALWLAADCHPQRWQLQRLCISQRIPSVFVLVKSSDIGFADDAEEAEFVYRQLEHLTRRA